MTDNTRSKASIDRLEDAITKLTSNQNTLTLTQHDLTTKIDGILAKLEFLELHHQHESSPSSSSTLPPSHNNVPNHPKHHMKLDVPRFDGSDPLGWIFKITQFFDYHSTLEEDCIRVAFFYMDGPALSWFQWMFKNGQISSWHALLQALELRFAPSQYEDPRGALFKLTQRGFVNDYLAEFESLANHIVGLPPPHLLSCFISSLNTDIRREVPALQPLSLIQATTLARLQEDKLNDHRRTTKGKFSLNPIPINQYTPSYFTTS